MINLALLTEAISEAHPTGEDIRVSAPELYYELKELRNEVRSQERQALVFTPGLFQPQWQEILKRCVEILEHHSKDMEILAFLTEAALRAEGWPGFDAALEVSTILICHHWESLYPQDEKDPVSAKTTAFAGLNGIEKKGALVQAISQQELSAPSTIETRFENFCRALEEKCGTAMPSMAFIRGALRAASEKHSAPSALETKTEKNTPPLLNTDRSAALHDIEKIAHYFERTEPNSPLACMLKRCVAFGRLAWPDLLTAMIAEEGILEKIFTVTGR